MKIRRIRLTETDPVLTELSVCFVSEVGWFVVRYTVRWPTPEGEIVTETVRSPLTHRQLILQSGGPELADHLMEHPDRWWRMPLPRYVEEDYAA